MPLRLCNVNHDKVFSNAKYSVSKDFYVCLTFFHLESMKDVKNDYEPEESQLKPVANGTKTDKKKQADSKIQK